MSKMVWIIAAIVLTASVIGVFQWQRRSMKEVEIEQRAEQVSSLIDELINTEGEFKGTVSFNESRDSDFHISPTLNDGSYDLNFTPRGLFIEQGGKKQWSGFLDQIHLFSPTLIDPYSQTSLESIDKRATSMQINSGMQAEFIIQSKRFDGGFEVFLYPRCPDNMTKELVKAGEKIDSFLGWSFGSDINMTDINSTEYVKSNISLEIYPTFLLHRNNSISIPYPIAKVHLWQPKNYRVNSTYINSSEAQNTSLHLYEQDEIRLERRLMSFDENLTVMNFAYRNVSKNKTS